MPANKPNNFDKVWMFFGLKKEPGIFYRNHFYNRILKIVKPDDWKLREKKICHIEFVQPKSGGASFANVIPLNQHPKFVQYVLPTTEISKPTSATKKEKN
ncbi:MAG: hypothetical protein COA86_02685 [Kangiella sp.]|nr:MAG: hypothetical protein COA86_02685 [Kangiella sp.]